MDTDSKQAELNLSSELSSDDFQFDHWFSNDEYCELNIDLFDGDVLETFGPELDDNDDFESLFFASVERETPNEITIKEEDASSTNSSLSDQRNSSPNSKLEDVHSLETAEAKNLPLPFIKPTPEFGTVGGDLNNNSHCFTETVIKQEVKEDECHFVPNLYEQFGRVSAKNHKKNSTLKSTSAEFCSGNIADLVKTRKRTCNNGKAKIDTNANLKSKNRTSCKKEQASNKNCAAKSATLVPVPSLKNRSPNASEFPLFPVIKIKKEPEENFQLFDGIKYQESKNSKSSCSTMHEPSNRQQNIPGKNNILSSSRKSKTKRRKKQPVPESTNHAATTVPECETFNCGSPPDSSKHSFPFPNPKCSPQSNENLVSFDFTPFPQCPRSPNSKIETVNKLLSACSRLSEKIKMNSVCSSPTENTKSSRQVESPSLLKLRISRCADQNQFKSYVVPAEPIPVYTVQSGLTKSGDHSVAGKYVESYSEEISQTLQNLKVEPLSDTDTSELYSEKQDKYVKETRISKTEKKKRRKVGKHKNSSQNTKPNKPITCDPNQTANMVESIHPHEVKTISDGSAQASLTFSIKREIEGISETKLTEQQDCVLGGDIGIQLQDEIPINQQSNVVSNENFLCEKSQHETRENFFPKARKKLKTNAEDDISEYETSNNDNQHDSDVVTTSLSYTANVISEIKSCSIAETIPVVKIKQEPVDTYEYSEFEMHQSVEVPLGDLNVTSPLDCQDLKGFRSVALEKSISLSCSEMHDQPAIAHEDVDFNDIIKVERYIYEKNTSSDSVPSSPSIECHSNNEQSYVSIPTSTYHVPPPSPFSMSKDIFETSQSSCDSDPPDENDKDNLVPFVKIADSQGSQTSSQGTIVNNENCFQESRAPDKSNDVGTKNNFFNSLSFSSSFRVKKTEQNKSPPLATSPEQNTFDVEPPYPSVCNSPIESTSIQRDSIAPKIPHCENKPTLSTKQNTPQSDKAKCTDAKVDDLQQHTQPNNEAMPSANSAFFIATMQNSFRFRIGKQSTEEAPKQTTATIDNKGNSSRDNSSECSSIEHKKIPRSTKSNARQYRSRKRSRSSSSGSSDSFYDDKASKRVKKYHISRRKEILESSRKKSSYSKYHNSSSRSSYNESKSSYSESRSSYSESRSSRYSYSSTYEERSRSPVESFRKTEPRKHYSHRSRSRHRRHRSSSRSRSRSPNPKYRRDSSYDRPRSISSSKRHMTEEQEKQTDERRVVYVGQIPDGFTTSDLRERFSRFGRIEDINIHRRNANRNNNFGFVTFKHTEDACDAIARGNDPPMKPRFDISFGGRRLFCRQRYSDLDKEKELMENNGYYYVPSSKANDFDSLLNAELRRTGLHDKK